MVSLLMARVIAESGMPFVRVKALNPSYLMGLLPAGWLTGVSIYLGAFIGFIFPVASRVSPTVMVSHALGLDENRSAGQQIRLCYLLIGVLVAGLVVCGAVHLRMSYHASGSLDGRTVPLSSWGPMMMSQTHKHLQSWHRGSWGAHSYNRVGHVAIGFGLAGALQWACLLTPKWPLHPIGMLMVATYYGNHAWASIFLGWAAKVLLVRYGGTALYRRMRPLFFGLIFGEIFSAIVWTAVPVLLILLGGDPAEVGHIQVLPQ
jgi:hypothetical protein